MGGTPEPEGAHGDVDRGLRYFAALLVVASRTSPADPPAEGALHDPPARNDLEARCLVGVVDDLDDEVEKCCVVQELRAIVASIGKHVIQPWPALAGGIEER